MRDEYSRYFDIRIHLYAFIDFTGVPCTNINLIINTELKGTSKVLQIPSNEVNRKRSTYEANSSRATSLSLLKVKQLSILTTSAG